MYKIKTAIVGHSLAEIKRNMREQCSAAEALSQDESLAVITE